MKVTDVDLWPRKLTTTGIFISPTDQSICEIAFIGLDEEIYNLPDHYLNLRRSVSIWIKAPMPGSRLSITMKFGVSSPPTLRRDSCFWGVAWIDLSVRPGYLWLATLCYICIVFSFAWFDLLSLFGTVLYIVRSTYSFRFWTETSESWRYFMIIMIFSVLLRSLNMEAWVWFCDVFAAISI